MKGWVYEVAEDADYNAGSPDHEKPFYFVEIRIPINRLDLLAKQGLIRDFTRVVLEAEGSDDTPANARRVWVTINELKTEDWGGSAATSTGCVTIQALLTTLAITKSPCDRPRAVRPPPSAVRGVDGNGSVNAARRAD
jgi:phenylpyruvate tautomerase PptA (4-oxalocrotonate tautomerase family)